MVCSSVRSFKRCIDVFQECGKKSLKIPKEQNYVSSCVDTTSTRKRRLNSHLSVKVEGKTFYSKMFKSTSSVNSEKKYI